MRKLKRKNKSTGFALAMKLNIAILIVLSALIVWSVLLVKEKLLKNADEMGTHLAQSYAMEEENRMSVYKMLMYLGAEYANENIQAGATREYMEEWLAGYSGHIAEMYGDNVIDPYAVIGDEIVAAVPWEGDSDYEYENTEWYKKAMEADGAIVFTNAYEDVITGKQLVTLAKKLNENGDVLAFDILMENFHSYKNKVTIPEKSSYFLFDGNGKLIYLASDLNSDDPEVQAYASELLDKIKNGELEDYDEMISDLDDDNRAVYYYEMKNGWLSVITIPVEKILVDGWNSVVLILAAFSLCLVIAIAVVLIRGYLDARKVKHTQDTLQILGDTYYAIYRINCEEETYEVIKSLDDVQELLDNKGKYSHLLDVMRRIVDADTYEEFCQSFSIENIRKLVKEKTSEFGGDYQRKFSDGYHWVSTKIIYNEALGLNEVILCFRDIDVEKKRQLQQQHLLETALESAKKTADAKTLFFSSVSHDMRTPLNAIIGLSDLAEKNRNDNNKVQEYINKIGKAGRQLLALINEILDMSRIEQGNQDALDYRKMDICNCVKDVTGLFSTLADQENKRLFLTLEVQHKTVHCDEYRLNQILNNLLSNAFKYSPEGAEIHVTLKEAVTDGNYAKYQIVIRDTGYGMSEKFLDQLFEPFSRETIFAPVKVIGTGLGMPIVKSIVQQMNGEITVQSELGKGSTFVITIPMQFIDSDKKKQNEDARKTKESAGRDDGEEESDILKGKTVLIAEDNEINMEIAAEILSMYGANILQAWNGKEAVDIFADMPENSIDIILMDMQMPMLDGCEAARAIRLLERRDASEVPIIAVTANTFAEDIAKTTQSGMDGHISKPIDFDKLIQFFREFKKRKNTDAGEDE